jgi:hypothetical protein
MKLPEPRVSQATHDQIAECRKRYASLFEEITTDVQEFVSTGSMSRARLLASSTGQHLNHNQYPMYFTGDLDAQLVLVHLNPKQEDDASARFAGPLVVKTFELSGMADGLIPGCVTRKFVEQAPDTQPGEGSPQPCDSLATDTEEFLILAATVRILEYYKEAGPAPRTITVTLNPSDSVPEQRQIKEHVLRMLGPARPRPD